MAALVLAVGSVGTVGFFADRVKGALTQQANLLLGADIMISGDRPLPPASRRCATRAGSRRRRSSASTAWCSQRPTRPTTRRRCLPTSRRSATAIRCAARSCSSIRRTAERQDAQRHSRRAARRGPTRASRDRLGVQGRRPDRRRRGDADRRRDRAAGARSRGHRCSRSGPSCCSTSTTFPRPTCCSPATARRGACSSPIAQRAGALERLSRMARQRS